MNDAQIPYYSDYLELGKILDSQHPKSFEPGKNRADDEMLFIIVHQAYELWFNLIIFEVDLIIQVLVKPEINDDSPDMNNVVRKLKRIVRILELLNQQVEVLETMTPLDFLAFRSSLIPASGFQSVQFRIIEAKLGLKIGQRHKESRESEYYKHTRRGGFSESDLKKINDAEKSDTLRDLVIRWLERMPFFNDEYWYSYQGTNKPNIEDKHKFWADYEDIYFNSLSEDDSDKSKEFSEVFVAKGLGEFSAKAMRAVLFIMLYRDWPIFRQPFELLSALVEIDELLSTWRYRHFMMVRRMIGTRAGTASTSGADYLEKTLDQYIFKELTIVTTFVIERNKLPELPEELRNRIGFGS